MVGTRRVKGAVSARTDRGCADDVCGPKRGAAAGAGVARSALGSVTSGVPRTQPNGWRADAVASTYRKFRWGGRGAFIFLPIITLEG